MTSLQENDFIYEKYHNIEKIDLTLPLRGL